MTDHFQNSVLDMMNCVSVCCYIAISTCMMPMGYYSKTTSRLKKKSYLSD